MELRVVLCLLSLVMSLYTAHGEADVEEGYEVATVFSANQEGQAVHVHSLYTDLQETEYLVVDSTGNSILTISLPLSQESEVKVLAGSGVAGYRNGNAPFAQFNHPQNAVRDDVGNVYVADTRKGAIRKVTDGRVTTIAGGSKIGFVDGLGEHASFSSDIEVHLDRITCNLIVADRGNNAVRSIRLDPGCCKRLRDNKVWNFLYGVAVGAGAILMVSVIVVNGSNIKALVSAFGSWFCVVAGSVKGVLGRALGQLTRRHPDYPNLIDV
eukprot:TRINITY_DN1705_c0_g1_i2.p1 TRINITY_DN1705_c0_g1~~TRINITY_DN1705_c0_g1_i2.p1  ORF type:complete len:268 (+),score=30.64 TRINITY_DN1705_c0_g1_i2:90-893(+)